MTITNANLTASEIPDLSGSYLSVNGGTLTGVLNSSSTATSTFAAGINITAGCFSVNGTCISGSVGGSGTVGSGTQGQFAFYDATGTTLAATSSLYISQSGNVGIGTTSLPDVLTLGVPFDASVTYGLRITNGTNQGSLGVGALGTWLGTVTDDPLYFFVNNDNASMTINTSGNVGIGTTTPWGRLSLTGADTSGLTPAFIAATPITTLFSM